MLVYYKQYNTELCMLTLIVHAAGCNKYDINGTMLCAVHTVTLSTQNCH